MTHVILALLRIRSKWTRILQIQLAQQFLQRFVADTILVAKLHGRGAFRISQISLDAFGDVVLFGKYAAGSARTLQGALAKPIMPGYVVVDCLHGMRCAIGTLA